jgi:hypothetical protein
MPHSSCQVLKWYFVFNFFATLVLPTIFVGT